MGDAGTPAVPAGPHTGALRRSRAPPTPPPQETSMTTTATDTDWRTDNDRDSHQRRLADELTADEGTW
jgi:hypothetical protein